MSLIRDAVAAVQTVFAGETPAETNNGNCQEWAEAVLVRCLGAETLWGDQLAPAEWSPRARAVPDVTGEYAAGHCFVRYRGRYYDAEAPQGVKWPDELPLFARDLADAEEYAGARSY